MDNLFQIPEAYLTIIEANFFALALVAVILYTFFAFYGYRIFQFSLKFISAVALGVVGSNLLGPVVANLLGSNTLGPINISSLIGIACAVIGFVIAIYLYKVTLFLLGAAGGFFGGQLLVGVLVEAGVLAEFLSGTVGFYVACGVCALIGGVIAALVFRPLFIVVSSVGSMLCAALIVASLVLTDVTGVIAVVALAIGLIVGVVASVKQFKAE